MKEDSKEIGWSKTGRSIFEKFAVGLQDFFKTGEYPSYGDQDVKYCLELQKKRLDKRNLTMEYEMVPRGHFAQGGGLGKSWSDDRYTSTMEYRSCQLRKDFYKEGKRVYRKIKDFLFYQIITNAHSMEGVRKDLYTCPSCGAVSNVETLQQGCPFCGTHFKISELFPKVTNFYFIEDVGGTEKEVTGSIKKTILPSILICAIGYTIYFYIKGEFGGYLLTAAIGGIFAGILAGGIMGYVYWACKKFSTVFVGAAKAVPKLVDMAGSQKRFAERMKEFSPEFSFEYFSAKVVSYLKMIIYSENAGNLPIYAGAPLENLTQNIVEASYTGATALRNFQIQGDICQVTVAVYMEDIYDLNGRIRKRDDIFYVTLQKNIRKPIDYHFSIKKIHCKGCGNSFDATKQRECPACGRMYEIEDEEWLVVKIRKS